MYTSWYNPIDGGNRKSTFKFEEKSDRWSLRHMSLTTVRRLVLVISCDRSGRIVFDYVCTEPLSACHPTFFTEARCPKAGCPSTHNQKYEIPHRPKEIYLKSFYDYSCGQTKPSNLLTDFLGLRKASELVDNGVNGLLLISFINSNQQNFQKWRFTVIHPLMIRRNH